MRELDELTDLVGSLNEAATFCDSADRLVAWARRVTGSETGLLRLNQRGLDGRLWAPACRHEGVSDAFARDETLVTGTECICGRVATGTAEVRPPFFTPYGSFVWGAVGSLSEEFLATALAPVRGRCMQEGYESIAVVPLGGPDGPIGCLHLADRRPGLFDGRLEVVEAACRVAGRMMLQHETKERERAAFQTVQSALLPPEAPPVPGLDLGVCFASATDMASIGGDFYDVVDLGAGRAALIVGDYSGHGIEAAGVASHARYVLASLAGSATSPGDLLLRANEALRARLPEDHFVSAAVCMVDLATGIVRVALAGHPSPIRLGSGETGEVEAPYNPPLGIFRHVHFAEAKTHLNDDDILLLVTDGIIESRRGGRLFGVQGVVDAWRGTRGSPLTDLARAVCEASGRHHDPSLLADDRLVLAVSLGASAPGHPGGA